MKRVISLAILAALTVIALASCGLAPPLPSIKNGEFNFTVTYELNGEIQTVSGVYACEYSGIDFALEGENHREWCGYIKDGNVEEIITLATAEDGGIVELNLHFEPGHLMGDPYYEGEEPFEPRLTVRLFDGGLYFENDPDLIAEVYGARIKSYECDAPVKNSFGLFN